MAARLRGRAVMIYGTLPESAKNDYNALVTELRKIFNSTDRTRYVHQQYKIRKRREKVKLVRITDAPYTSWSWQL